MLLLRNADSGQINQMAAEPTHGPHYHAPAQAGYCTLLAIDNVSLAGGSSNATTLIQLFSYSHTKTRFTSPADTKPAEAIKM